MFVLMSECLRFYLLRRSWVAECMRLGIQAIETRVFYGTFGIQPIDTRVFYVILGIQAVEGRVFYGTCGIHATETCVFCGTSGIQAIEACVFCLGHQMLTHKVWDPPWRPLSGDGPVDQVTSQLVDQSTS